MVGAVFCLLWCGRANDVRYSAAGSVEARKAPAVHPWLVDRCTSSLSPETLISWSETSSQRRQWIDWQERGHVTPTLAPSYALYVHGRQVLSLQCWHSKMYQ